MDVCAPLTSDSEWDWACQHSTDVAQEAALPPSPWPGIIEQHGRVEAWLADCRRRRDADSDRRQARVLLMLMADAPGRPRGTLRPPERARLLADRALAAYWSSVASAGDEGYDEERRRLRAEVGRASTVTEDRGAAIDGNAVARLMPLWRAWGQVLLDNDAVDLDRAFLPPG